MLMVKLKKGKKRWLMYRGGKRLKEWLKFFWFCDDFCNNVYGDYIEYKFFWKIIIVVDFVIINVIFYY